MLAVEYPGYGLYKSEPSSAETILENAYAVVEWLIKDIGYSTKDLVFVGRSMGTGPSCQLAAKYQSVAGLVLISPYTSLRAATASYIGSFASLIVRERFDNAKAIQGVRCPTLIIHGQNDDIIPESHALELHKTCGGPCKLIMPETMTHNEFDTQKDLVRPIAQFFVESNIVPTFCISKEVKRVKHRWQIPPKPVVDLCSAKEQDMLKRMIKQAHNKKLATERTKYAP